MRRMWAVVLIAVFASQARSAFGPEQSKGTAGFPGEWLASFSATARHAAMGNAGVGLKGAGAPYANPAGIAGLPMAEANMMMAPLLSAGQYQSLSLVYPVERARQGWAMTVLHMTSGDAEQTNNLGETVGSFKDQNTAALFSYARGFWFSVDGGVNVKYVRQSLAGKGDGSFGIDAGLQKDFDGVGDGRLTVGVAAFNVLSPALQLDEVEETFPRVYRAGGAYHTAWNGRTVIVAADLIRVDSPDATQRWAAGVEVQPFKEAFFPLFLRLGMNHRAYTAGVGFMKSPISLNYAVEFNELDLLHRFGVSFRFGLLSPVAEAKLKGEWKRLHEREAMMHREMEEKGVRLRQLKSELRKERRLVRREAPKREETDEKEPAIPPMEKARRYYRDKEYEKALSLLVKQKEKGSLDDRGLSFMELLQARLELEKGRYEEAGRHLIEAVQYDPLNGEAEQLYKRTKEIIDIEAKAGD